MNLTEEIPMAIQELPGASEVYTIGPGKKDQFLEK